MAELVTRPAPSRARRVQIVGQLSDGATVPFIYESVLQEILRFSDAERRLERGGFLLGGVFDDEGCYVEVNGFLPARATVGHAARLCFTHDTWAQLHDEIARRDPPPQIVGWHHTHPQLGVFLSDYDRFIHRHFFSAAWQLALVVDPCRGELAFFQWRGEDIVDCGFVYVPGDPPGTPPAQGSVTRR